MRVAALRKNHFKVALRCMCKKSPSKLRIATRGDETRVLRSHNTSPKVLIPKYAVTVQNASV